MTMLKPEDGIYTRDREQERLLVEILKKRHDVTTNTKPTPLDRLAGLEFKVQSWLPAGRAYIVSGGAVVGMVNFEELTVH